jgi:hypothetical protein
MIFMLMFFFVSPEPAGYKELGSFYPNSVSASTDSLASDNLRQTDTTLKILAPEPVFVYPIVENNAFQIGEKLTFKVRYGFVRAGTATMSVLKETILNERPVYQIQTTAESVSPFSWVYKVDDVVNSFIDKEGLFSWRFEKKLREGSYKIDLLVDYIPKDSLAKIHTIRYKDDIEENRYDVKVPPFALDVLAAFYFVRTKPLRVGDIVSIINHDNKKVYNLEIHVYMREEIDTAAGTFKCLRIEPQLKGEGIFQQKGRLLVWITDDKYKIPVQMTSEVAVGHITTELEKIEGINHKLPSLISE